MKERVSKALFTAAASFVAVLIALTLCGLMLWFTGKNPFSVYWEMIKYGVEPRSLTDTVQRATPLILSGVAVAIGFKMNLFNIGVEGQYRLAMLVAAALGAMVNLPAVLHVIFCCVIAMTTGALWSGIAGYLKVRRGVNEVISTIMLNSIALGLMAFLFDEFFRSESGGNLDVKTKVLPKSAWMPDLVNGSSGVISWFFVVSLVVAGLYWVIVWFTPFGFRLRASGVNPSAARVGGVNPNSMVLKSMLVSGLVAGLVGMPAVLGDVHAYGQGLPKELGFAGIAVALLGRNHPVGIVIAAFLFAFLDRSSAILQFQDVPKEITAIIQGVMVLSVVIVNEAMGRAYDRSTKSRTAIPIDHSPEPDDEISTQDVERLAV